MELHEQVRLIRTREDLANFVEALRQDLILNPKDWENPSLERFLEAMGAWIEAMPSAYENNGLELPMQPTWEIFADILLASKMYE